jgi:hypothetical protein
MDLLGIDQRGHELKASRNWNGVKDFFKMKLTEINALKDNFKTGTGKDRLLSAMLEESIEALTRQLSKTPFFHDILGMPAPDTSELPDPSKLTYAPLSNLGCESEFAWFNNRVKISGGTESVESISRKNVISTNGLLVDSAFLGLSNEERSNEWKWARHSTATLEARKLQRDFIATLKQIKKLVLAKKKRNSN